MLLSTRGLRVGVAGRTFCRDLTLEVRAGERLAILGRNGAGKSTLLAVLAGLRKPEAGEVLLAGAAYSRLGARASARIRGWLPQGGSDAFSSSVLESALTGRHPHLARWDWESDEDARIAYQALAEVGLAGLAQRDTRTLSGGERQRLAIATLLAQAPRLYLLDEPLAHLDLNHQMALLELFARLALDQPATCVMVLHEPGLAARFCTHALLMFGDGTTRHGRCGEVITSESLSALYGYPLREIVEDGQRWFMPA
ncbi:ABC transporter ATP-binding protein [Accumulibacter sp.]|uniref:ABC transporter ATP-binding protein n=1 Tax=Accumulibacter sp. TaxID=2053492 RepID=UPI0025EB0145|nr:ABC transporter ATP-binding protein [Accumulibacter sp.]MCM8594354.1 ABC transporter ATP-binding protein [Accumulibacter sp.]MCM8625011.1 ABC transporter ATP-binding protein [Accumulibacter sp.]MDS4048498.1 ABC transporter ATP-binding protein [Accumulibacter sp.]